MLNNYLISIIISFLGINMTVLFMILKKPLLNKNEYLHYFGRNLTFILFYYTSSSIYYRILKNMTLTRTIFSSYLLILFLIIDILIHYEHRKLIALFLSTIIIIRFSNLLDSLMLMNILLFIFELYELFLLNKLRKSFTSRLSIKQAFDTMDDGILFLDDNYNVMLMNTSMYELSKLCELQYEKAEKELYKTILDNIEDDFFKINNQTYTVIKSKSNHKYKGNYYQFIDVSKYFVLLEQLENQNKFLISKQNELKQSILNIENTVFENEILNLRFRIHDILGQRLSIVHSYIENMSSKNNIYKIKEMLKNIRADLILDSNLTVENKFDALVKTFELVNTNIKLNGKFPKDNEISLIFLNIIREASTNAIRHGGARNVYVNIFETLEKVFLIIYNDGNLIEGDYIEGDGILGMKRALLSYDSTFKIIPENNFKIEIAIKKDLS